MYLRTLEENETKQTFGKNQQEFEHPLKEPLNPRAYYKASPLVDDPRAEPILVSNMNETEVPERSFNGVGNGDTASQRDPFLQRVTKYKDIFHELQDNMQKQDFAQRNSAYNTQSLFSAITNDKVPKITLPVNKGLETPGKDQKITTFSSQMQREKLPALTPKRTSPRRGQSQEKPLPPKKIPIPSVD